MQGHRATGMQVRFLEMSSRTMPAGRGFLGPWQGHASRLPASPSPGLSPRKPLPSCSPVPGPQRGPSGVFGCDPSLHPTLGRCSCLWPCSDLTSSPQRLGPPVDTTSPPCGFARVAMSTLRECRAGPRAVCRGRDWGLAPCLWARLEGSLGERCPHLLGRSSQRCRSWSSCAAGWSRS